MDFGLGGLGLDFGAGAEGGGVFGGTPLEGLPDPAKDMFNKMNSGKLSLENKQQLQTNANNLAYDRAAFAQKMSYADQFGINKLSLLGVPATSGSQPMYSSTGQGNFSSSASHAVPIDPDEKTILGNNVRISGANARMAESNATLAEMDVKSRQSALTGTGRPPSSRVSNDKLDSILRTVDVGGNDFKLANPRVLPEQYNYGENFTALVNAGVDPRLALSLSATELQNPTSWLTPAITAGQLLREKFFPGAPFYNQLRDMGYKPGADGSIRVNPQKGGK